MIILYFRDDYSRNANILVINCGSSSIKFQIIEPKAADIKLSGIVERIGEATSKVKFKFYDKGKLFSKKEKSIKQRTNTNNKTNSELYTQAFDEIADLIKERCVSCFSALLYKVFVENDKFIYDFNFLFYNAMYLNLD